MNDTLQDIYKVVYDKLGESQTSTIFIKSRIIKEINDFTMKVCKGEIVNHFKDTTINAGMLSFLHEEEVVSIPRRKTLILTANY
jgi:hypothetical protein